MSEALYHREEGKSPFYSSDFKIFISDLLNKSPEPAKTKEPKNVFNRNLHLLHFEAF